MAAGGFFFFSRSTQMETLLRLPATTVRVSYVCNNTRTCSAHVPQSKHSLQFSKLRLLKGIWKQTERAADCEAKVSIARDQSSWMRSLSTGKHLKINWNITRPPHDPVQHSFRMLYYVPWLVQTKNVFFFFFFFCNLGQEVEHKICEPCINRVECLRKDWEKEKNPSGSTRASSLQTLMWTGEFSWNIRFTWKVQKCQKIVCNHDRVVWSASSTPYK